MVEEEKEEEIDRLRRENSDLKREIFILRKQMQANKVHERRKMKLCALMLGKEGKIFE